MAIKPQPPTRTTGPAFPATAPAPLEKPYVLGDALPVPEVIEKNSDSVWQLWSDASEDPARPAFRDTAPETGETPTDADSATQIMGLDELPGASGN